MTTTKQKVIIVKSMNMTPEDEVNARLEELGPDWRIVSATTAMQPFGETDLNSPQTGKFYGVALHMYFVTTVIVERQ